jgi:membrane-bound ClpP family serine protease
MMNQTTSGQRMAACSLTALALVIALAWTPSARAQNQVVEGQVIAVDNPITDDVARGVLRLADKRYARFLDDRKKAVNQDRALKIIFDFNARSDRNVSPDFEGCYKLAKGIRNNYSDALTVAFVHGEVSRHTVLPVIACKELVLSQKSVLGPVVTDGEPPLDRDSPEWRAYATIMKGRIRTPDILLKLLDRDMEILEELGNPRKVLVGKGVKSYTPSLKGDREILEKLDTFKAIRESKEEVANLYGLPPGSVRDELMGQTPRAWKATVAGPVTRAQVESLIRGIRQATSARGDSPGANLVILQLECAGGDWSAAMDLATFLQNLKDDTDQMKVETVAYIPDRAPDTAAIVAFGCSKIIMLARPAQAQEPAHEAQLGDFSLFVPPGQSARDTRLKVDALSALLQARNYKTILAQGLLEREVVLDEVFLKDTGDPELITDDQWKEDQARPDAQRRYVPGNSRQIKGGNELLVLSAQKAKELRVAADVVDGLPGLYALYDLKTDQVTESRSDWLDSLVYFLRLPVTTIILFALGFTCLILEMKLPGAILPGVVSAICFVLFFWAWFGGSEVFILAVLLFILGLILIGLEVFVMPGVAVVGLSGALLVVFSLALVTLQRWPRGPSEWESVAWMATVFAGSMAGAMVAAFVLAWYLPNIPYFRRLILKPAGEEDDLLAESGPAAIGQVDYSGLLGAIGTAATPLRPAGKVQFGDQFIDVLAEGSYVELGTRVQVIEIEGNRIVVKEV